ncbi:serine hydrolase domain-containing protein [Patiriisocius hiemis]|uniref:Serine hydrolase n=1 Tax=Patiriisocius hiemis TaxID=3075604 RepID=A0ABU2YAA8_9FLAO|nr:serine hydrolase [Constantimarinum sp. W242]MDT0554952.1 serine hydrolase [Constantimarinum sp. W242]
MKNLTIKLVLFLVLTSLFSSCKVGRFVTYNFADITDHKIFPSRTIETSQEPFLYPYTQNGFVPDSLSVTRKGKNTRVPFKTYLEDNKTVAFIIIHKDSIRYENYFNKYDETSIVNSFSMAKSFLSILVGCALDDGLITSIKEPITNYLPELKANGFENITIEHLLNMESGIEFNESYINPFGHAASFYYGTNIRKEVSKLKVEVKEGKRFSYRSGDSQILGLVLDAALGEKNISEYLEEKIWKPLGMEYNATWSLDRKKDGVEKTFCCVNARARDFAKIGTLYLKKGNWNGKQIVSKDWVEKSTKYDTINSKAGHYQHQWWINKKDNSYEAEGILGQHIYVNPEKEIIIVRLGKKVGKTGSWTSLFQGIAAKY